MRKFYCLLLAAALTLTAFGCSAQPDALEKSEWLPGVREFTNGEGDVYYTVHHPEKDGVLSAVITGPDGTTLMKGYAEEGRADYITIDADGEVSHWSREIPLQEVWSFAGEAEALAGGEKPVKPVEQGNSCEVSHPWIGNSLTFKSETLGITVEFPISWEPLVAIYEEDEYIRVDVVNGWDPAEAASGLIAKIYRFSKGDWENNTENIPVEIYDDGETYLMAERDDTVIVLYRYGGLVNYGNRNSSGFKEYQEISQSLQGGNYCAWFS